MVKVAHQIREQLEYYRKNQGNVAVKIDDPLLDIKKSTRNLITLNDTHQKNQDFPTADDFIRRNNDDW
jgi:hypothetical protein